MHGEKFPLRHDKALESVEIVDKQNRPLCVLPFSEVRRQSLCHRAVLVLVFNPGNKVYLQKRSPQKELYPGRLDLSITGHVRVGESREEAAVRALREELGIYADGIDPLVEVWAGPQTGLGFVTFFPLDCRGRAINFEAWGADRGLFVDKGELDYLAENFREMLTPSLVYFWKKNLIFPCLGL
ncbi:MAG: NUDIX domain-containing protein [Thermodesulfobacteriota bacterium]|nr:NUDIX domain-containing protein [Thermodesulfobacteriota bacterium]